MGAARPQTAREPATIPKADGSAVQEWALPTDPAFLTGFLTDLFQRYWDQIIFGPLVEGAAYEFVPACAPTGIDVSNGFLTIHFDKAHFHLCVGEISGGPGTPEAEAYKRRCRPAKAVIVRRLDKRGAPISWGFELVNSGGASMMTVFFASPFAAPGDHLLDTPEWERLAMWRDIARRYLGREPEDFDASGLGFKAA